MIRRRSMREGLPQGRSTAATRRSWQPFSAAGPGARGAMRSGGTMKFSLDAVGYGGDFTDGAHLPLEDVFRKAAEIGYDAACIYAPRPLGFPIDPRQDRIKRLKGLAREPDPER